MTAADVAVIVPVFNRSATVREALDSVARQGLPPRELIVVDDGSTDGSGDSVEAWTAATRVPFPVRLIRQENRGVSAARNRGIREVGRCRFFAFLDSDDVWPADFLQRTGSVLSARGDAVAASCDRRFVDASGAARLDCLAGLAANATQWLFVNDAGIASTTLFRASLIQRLGGFREHLLAMEDAELFFRLSLLGPWLHVPGEAVTRGQGLAESRGEAGHLSVQFDDKCRKMARVYESFVEDQGGKEALPRSICARVLSKQWYRAGRELMRNGRLAESRECFRASATWRFWNKAWLRLAQTYVARAA